VESIASCRSCERAYLRVPGGRFYAWECCGLGARPFERHMPDDWACDLYQPGEYRPRVDVVTIIEGEGIEI
jgi:hypothetical protein